ncbi:tail assembly chaperone gp38 [Yersinia frederiksenii]|uniref:tail fiber assembly protein n=1 Tax=Yersinia frederiksenii TaxID=29484 RepID=UPI0005E5A2E0|nr:tail fiber assembly protein [Yersinia frederiksenii]CFR10274.1 tail assembly chaperone gp38 [Yersinia frederiksenii]
MNYFYSAITNMFYPVSLRADYEASGSWPEDGIEVDGAVYKEFAADLAPTGKVRSSKDGLPVWIDIPPEPPLTKAQLVAAATEKKAQLKFAADSEIEWRQDAVDGGYAEPEEVTALAGWKKYRVMLMRVDTSKAPDIEWPVPPVVVLSEA